jgi:hypothetical protein
MVVNTFSPVLVLAVAHQIFDDLNHFKNDTFINIDEMWKEAMPNGIVF